MSDGPGFFDYIGIHIQPAFAGAAGGIVAAWMNKAATVAEWGFYVLCGFLTANFATHSALGFVNVPYLDEGGMGFFLGSVATLIYWGMAEFTKAQFAKFGPTQGKGSQDPS
jgi:type III secretory pathway component EscT